MDKFVKKIGTIDRGVVMEKYISESDLKKYLDKQYKEAVRLRDMKDEHNSDISDDLDAYYQGQIDQMEEIANELDLGILGLL